MRGSQLTGVLSEDMKSNLLTEFKFKRQRNWKLLLLINQSGCPGISAFIHQHAKNHLRFK